MDTFEDVVYSSILDLDILKKFSRVLMPCELTFDSY